MIIEKLAEIIANKLDCDVADITAETKLTDLGMDSLDIAELLMDISDEFGVEIEVSPDIQLVSDLVAKIEELKAE
ncbi:MAG: acyl carrier protein [Clostridiales bacterium]|nr:acyl carrier protein [Clostridiales bacterium]